MSGGFYRDGKWITSVIGGYSASTDEADRAVVAAIAMVEAGETTARNAVRELLTEFPVLKQDRENHPLCALIGHYCHEVLNDQPKIANFTRTN